jgi:hypothetical protein
MTKDPDHPDELIDYLGGEKLNLPALQAAHDLWFFALRVDPNTDAGTQALKDLKRLEIRGDRLEKLFHTICLGSFRSILTLIRAESLAILSTADLNSIIDDEKPVDLPSLLAQVQSRLPDFGTENR